MQLDARRSIEYFKACPGAELALYVVGVKPDLSDAFVGFEIQTQHGHKASVLTSEETGHLHCQVAESSRSPCALGFRLI